MGVREQTCPTALGEVGANECHSLVSLAQSTWITPYWEMILYRKKQTKEQGVNVMDFSIEMDPKTLELSNSCLCPNY